MEKLDLLSQAVTRDLGAVWFQSTSTLLVAVFSGLVAFVLSFLVCLSIPQLRRSLWLGAGVAFIAALIGFLTGHVTGNSRTSITGDVTPVLLAGVAGIFVLSLNHERLNTALAGVFVAAFGLSFFQGAGLGSFHRELTTASAQATVIVAPPAQEEKAEDTDAETTPSFDLGALRGTTPQTLPQPLPWPLPLPIPGQDDPTVPPVFRPVPDIWNPYQFVPPGGQGNWYLPQDQNSNIYVLPDGVDLQELLQAVPDLGQ